MPCGGLQGMGVACLGSVVRSLAATREVAAVTRPMVKGGGGARVSGGGSKHPGMQRPITRLAEEEVCSGTL